MATLTGQTIASTYDALLKVTDNGPITSSLKLITDGLGNNTALSLSNAGASITGTLSVSSTISASNLSGTNTGDETNATIKTKLGAATTSVDGYLTSTDWNTFNNKQSALTNPITGTGTTNTLPKFTGASALGNSNITDTGSLITLGSNTNISSGALGFGTSTLTGYIIRIASNLTGATSTFGVNNSPTIQSDVTSASRLFRTNPSTSVASFTLANLYHFIAEQATIGAGSVVTSQYGFFVDASLIGATNNFGFRGQIPSSLNNYNLYMNGTAANYLAGDVGIGVTQNYVSSGPILTTTLTNGGSGYVDATYTDVAGSATTGSGTSSLFTVIVSGGIVTSATLTWGGANWRAGDTLTISNTLLGGSGSGLVITVATVDSSQLKISNINGADITLSRADTTTVANDNIGSIKFEHNDGSTKASGLQAKISAFGSSAAGYGSYLSFFTKAASTGASLVEGLRILPDANVFIPTTALGIGSSTLTGYVLRLGKNITGATVSYGIRNTGVIQSDVTSTAIYYDSTPATQATTFTLDTLLHFRATQGTFGAGSTVTNQYGVFISSSLSGATNNYGLYSDILSGANRWNLYMNGTANNYMAGSLGIGTTSLAGYNLAVHKTITGATSCFAVSMQAAVQSDVTGSSTSYLSSPGTQAASFTVGAIRHFNAQQGTFGAGSTVTEQVGFLAQANLIGATTNIGFKGQVPSGTNRWNLYMDGTAANYLAGNVNIGSTTNVVASSGLSQIFKIISSTNTGILFQNHANDATGGALYFTKTRSGTGGNYTSGVLSNDVMMFLAGEGSDGVSALRRAGTIQIVAEANFGAASSPGRIVFGTTASGSVSVTERMRINSSGNLLINSTTDNSTGAKLQVNGGITYVNIFNRQTASYTLVLTDQNDIVEMNVASANNLTIPLNATVAFPIGTEIAVLQYGAGQTTIVATVGVTLRAKANALKISGQFAGCTLVKVGTDEWYVIGDLTA
jgi:hypothetical protein